MGQGAACCSGLGASALPASRGLMAWIDAHLRRELVSPTSWQGGGCFLFSCPDRQGGALCPAVGSTVQGADVE